MIYIKDMDMPVDCLACQISCKHESYRVTGRPEDCPLEEAKDGDLISRADAIEAMCGECLREHCETECLCGCSFKDALSALPSAEDTCATCADRALCIMSAPDGNWKACKDYRPSAEAEPKMTEEVREALMRLTMCAREECGMCKYKDECGFDFQYKISTENMHTILDALSAEAVQLKQTDTLIIADALRYLAQDTERHLSDRTRADALREQILKYGASMCHSAEAVHGWIPCSERLPSESGDYLATIPLDADETYAEVLTFHKGRFYEDDDEWGATYHDDVLAWMPLPMPYREEREVEE